MTDTSKIVENYATLQTAIADTIIRQDLASHVPRFIRMAEAHMRRHLKTRYLSQYRLDVMTGDDEIALPSDYRLMENIQVVEGQSPLEYVSQNNLDGLTINTLSDPQYYTIQGNSILLYPKPAAGTQIAYRYQKKMPVLTDANPVNDILLEFPDLYLYGSLAHTAPFLNDDKRLPVWKALYGEIMDSVNDDANQALQGVRMSLTPIRGTWV